MKSFESVRAGSLVLFRNQPACVVNVGQKILIDLGDHHDQRQVRLKDIELLHPGPCAGIGSLDTPSGDIITGWELLSGSTSTIQDIAELIFGSYTPSSAWAVWKLVMDGVYFTGLPDKIEAATSETVQKRIDSRTFAENAKKSLDACLERLRACTYAPEDAVHIAEIESVALGQKSRSRVLRSLGKSETAEDAHALLLAIGAWSEMRNPHPVRCGVVLHPPPDSTSVDAEIRDDDRMDLTHLVSYAIDDEGSDTPDDAISFDGTHIWIHVADPASAILPDSDADLEARSRGSTLYLPEQTVAMLHTSAVDTYGLGINSISPALSFRLGISDDGSLKDIEIVPSLIRATRLTYAEADEYLGDSPLSDIRRVTDTHEAYRHGQGAITLRLPEVRVLVRDDQISIVPFVRYASRSVVSEAMIMAGEATALYGQTNGIPLPYATQEALEDRVEPTTCSEMHSYVRIMKPRQYRSIPGRHAGLGLSSYVQATSPLRRYLDLVAHQQIRSFLRKTAMLSEKEILSRVGETEAVLPIVKRADQLSNQFWTMVYLRRKDAWEGEGILIDIRGNSGTVLLNGLGLQTRIVLQRMLPLDSVLRIALTRVDIPHLHAQFRVI